MRSPVHFPRRKHNKGNNGNDNNKKNRNKNNSKRNNENINVNNNCNKIGIRKRGKAVRATIQITAVNDHRNGKHKNHMRNKCTTTIKEQRLPEQLFLKNATHTERHGKDLRGFFAHAEVKIPTQQF
jgi:hypothetical protein